MFVTRLKFSFKNNDFLSTQLEMLWLLHTLIPMAKIFRNAILLNLFKVVLDTVTY